MQDQSIKTAVWNPLLKAVLLIASMYYLMGKVFPWAENTVKTKIEDQQKSIDSLEQRQKEILKRAAVHVLSADSAIDVMNVSKKERLKLQLQYEKINNDIDRWTTDQLDSFLTIH